MATFRHQIVISGVPRHRLDAVAAALFSLAESPELSTTALVTVPHELHFLDPTGRTWIDDDPSSDAPGPPAGARLVEGEHLKPGARYLLTDGESVSEVTVRQWPSPGPASRGDMEISTATPRGTTPHDVTGVKQQRGWWQRERRPTPSPTSAPPLLVSGDLHLAGGATPRQATASLNLRLTSAPKRLTQVSADARADVDAWFEAASTRRPASRRSHIGIRIRHHLGIADVRVRLVETRGGAWKVAVTAVLRGASILRPLIAITLLTKRRAIRDRFRSGLEEFAAHWNGTANAREHPKDAPADPSAAGSAQRGGDDTSPVARPRRTMTPHQWQLVAWRIHRMAECGHEPWMTWSHRLSTQEKAGDTPRAQFEAFHESFALLRPLEQGEAILACMVETLTTTDRTV